ncbi:hypothetical protein S40285_01834 [Stachybotrys chlorohalonatus IBT 40285]|uniref:GH16 domain-containing protein n=1 Tax=Stachybotrys chlorohalonatus (strain IBT 40285) TaxID=1283841 RepID=A0A084QH92_STAC4|nr:hypothetical protein S40285_01834 [Stachybotrys chlorohalonata IBT 40285]
MLLISALASLLTVAGAIESPQYAGYTRNFQATWAGAANTLPSSNDWNIINSPLVYNNEFQTYTHNPTNVRFSGSGTLQLIPLRNSSSPRGWTSGRIESKFTVTPPAGKVVRVVASLRIAGNPTANKQGLWPAFWLLGNSYRQGVLWPACGEIDIFENINGQPTVHGVVHCDRNPGGACNEPIGLVNTTALPDNTFHIYRVDINRLSSDWRQQHITWYIDGVRFNRVTGAQVNNQAVWATLAHSPLYIILNVAVGGDWPGPPNANTWGGTGSMMEVRFVSTYTSN